MPRFTPDSARLVLLCLLLAIYAVLGQPTPDEIGLVELMMGGLLVLFVGFTGAVRSMGGLAATGGNLPLSFRFLSAAFLLFFVVCLLSTAFRQQPLGEAVRDLVAVFYTALPLLVVPALGGWWRDERPIEIVSHALAILGLVYSIRHFISAGVGFSDVGTGFYNSTGLYFSTDPSVLFCASFCIGKSIEGFSTRNTLNGATRSLLYGMIALVAVAALAVKGHRGSLGVLMLCVAGFYFSGGGSYARRTILLIAGLGIVYFLMGDVVANVFERLRMKSEATGLNGRSYETEAVIRHVASQSFGELIGMGFGSVFSNPVIGMAKVNFTHLSFSFFLLKAGFFGLLFVFLYLFCVLRWAWVAYFRGYSVIAISSSGAILIGFFINGSFRYLSFGIIIMLLFLAADSSRRTGGK